MTRPNPDFEGQPTPQTPISQERGSARFSVGRVVNFFRDRDLIPPKRESVALAVGIVLMLAAKAITLEGMPDSIKAYVALPLAFIPVATLFLSDELSSK